MDLPIAEAQACGQEALPITGAQVTEAQACGQEALLITEAQVTEAQACERQARRFTEALRVIVASPAMPRPALEADIPLARRLPAAGLVEEPLHMHSLRGNLAPRLTLEAGTPWEVRPRLAVAAPTVAVGSTGLEAVASTVVVGAMPAAASTAVAAAVMAEGRVAKPEPLLANSRFRLA
jgi:hypothetical protein